MKVLKKGVTWTAEIDCSGKGMGETGCKARLEINEKDIFMVYGGGYCESIPYHGIKCPECGVTTCLEDSKIQIPGQFKKKGYFPDRPDSVMKNREICYEEGNRG